MERSRDPRLVLRFAVASLAAFVLVGVVGMALMVRYARERAESMGVFHSTFVADAVLAPVLADVDLSEPLAGPEYDRVLGVVRDRILSDGRDVRLKVWRPDATILFSDEAELVGRRFPEEIVELAEVMEGHVESEISDLAADENVEERREADKLLEVYVPLRLEPGGPVVGVAELYQDYAVIQADIDAFVWRLAPILAVGLLVLYAAILPIAVRAARELRRRNERLNELLRREQETVAELRDLHQKKDDFVAAASHELRTPLTSIVGSLATLKRPELGGDPAVRAEFLGAAERQVKRLQRLITNLLAAARLEESAGPVRIELVDLGATIASVVDELDARSRIRVELPSGPSVPTDRARLTEALTALMDNALKYSPDGSTVEVGGAVEDRSLRIWITDRGMGIDPSEHEAIFDRFHQVDQSATRRFGGLGLGLHVSRAALERLGGRIEVSSAPGRGSTFTIVVPLGELAARAS